MADPGTIYSDDEIEIFSEEDSEEEEMIGDKNSFSIGKYLNNDTEHDLDGTVARLLTEDKDSKKKLEEVKCSEDSNDIKKVLICKPEKIKSEKKRLRRKERNEELLASNLEKEKEEIGCEDALLTDSKISFDDMNLSIHILRSIAFMGYKKPTPIQAAAIPLALQGRDIFGCAATGTGKTAAYMFPIIQRLIYKPMNENAIRVLVMVPTRELGVQVFEVAREASKFTELSFSLSVGGLDRITQSKELVKHPDVVIATPGRLIDHLHNTTGFSLKDVEILVLDEADRMLDEYFVEQLTEIVQQCSSSRQTMLFSATMSEKVKDLVVVSLKNPVRVFINNNTAVAENLSQEFIRLKKNFQNAESRLAVLAHLLVNNCKEETIVFLQQKSDCHRLRILFKLLGIACGELHADLKQNQRIINLHRFKKKEINVLFATDIAARGLDIKGVKRVINFNVPSSYQMYVHRVGRTARAGKSGKSITISYDSGKDYAMLHRIQKSSYTPLFERIISTKHIKEFKEKLEDINPIVEKVLNREKMEKLYGVVNSTPKNKKLSKNNCKDTKSKKTSRKEVKQEIKRLEETLKLLNRGILNEPEPKKRNVEPQAKNEDFKNRDINKSKKNKKPKKIHNKKEIKSGSSYFDKEICIGNFKKNN